MADHEAKPNQRRSAARTGSERCELDGLNLPEEYEPCVLDEIAVGFEEKIKGLEDKIIDLLQGDKSEDEPSITPNGPAVKRKRKRKLEDGTEIEEDVDSLDLSAGIPSREEMRLEHEREATQTNGPNSLDFASTLNLPKRKKPGKNSKIKKGFAPRYGSPVLEEDTRSLDKNSKKVTLEEE